MKYKLKLIPTILSMPGDYYVFRFDSKSSKLFSDLSSSLSLTLKECRYYCRLNKNGRKYQIIPI